MSKTAQLDDDAHALIVDKQKELKRRRNVTVRISDLLSMYVKYSVNKTEELLGLKREREQSDVIDGDKQELKDKPKDDETRLVQEVSEVREIKA